MSIKQSLYKALDKIGTSNGHNVPESQDPLVPLVHEYNVTTIAEAYFKTRRDVAKKTLLKKLSPEQMQRAEELVSETKKSEVGSSLSIAETEPYVLTLETRNGATYLDEPALRVKMMKDLKLTQLEVDAMFEACRLRRDPTQSWKVSER